MCFALVILYEVHSNMHISFTYGACAKQNQQKPMAQIKPLQKVRMGTVTGHFYIDNQSQSCDGNGKTKNENEIVLSKMCVIEKYINPYRQYRLLFVKNCNKVHYDVCIS